MSAQHTPGPWEAEKIRSVLVGLQRPTKRIIGIKTQADARQSMPMPALAVVYVDQQTPGLGGGVSPEECVANAHLMAAAPDLLAACYAAYDLIDRVGDARKDAPILEELGAAIAKAEGR
jgi:hypothetical protein